VIRVAVPAQHPIILSTPNHGKEPTMHAKADAFTNPR
jgi:hypothetical protein